MVEIKLLKFEKILYMALATLAAGCFWCTETLFARINGVKSVLPGYTDGHIKNPAYREVCTGRTGHAECIQLEYDPKQITFETLLDVFFDTHDPTTLNRQGNDIGTQYRSGIYFHDEEQQQIAEKMIRELAEKQAYAAPIVTEVKPFTVFYPAEIEHQDYYNLNKNQPYCSAVITPKVKKLLDLHASKLK